MFDFNTLNKFVTIKYFKSKEKYLIFKYLYLSFIMISCHRRKSRDAIYHDYSHDKKLFFINLLFNLIVSTFCDLH